MWKQWSREKRIPCPGKIRKIRGSFAWLDHKIRSKCLACMSLEELALYVFLVLASDAEGISYYRMETISDVFGISWSQFQEARQRLIDKGLIAFEPLSEHEVNGFYQVLDVDEGAIERWIKQNSFFSLRGLNDGKRQGA